MQLCEEFASSFNREREISWSRGEIGAPGGFAAESPDMKDFFTASRNLGMRSDRHLAWALGKA